jgi:hypothetical protein
MANVSKHTQENKEETLPIVALLDAEGCSNVTMDEPHNLRNAVSLSGRATL